MLVDDKITVAAKLSSFVLFARNLIWNVIIMGCTGLKGWDGKDSKGSALTTITNDDRKGK